MQRHLIWGLPVIAVIAVLAVIVLASATTSSDVQAGQEATPTATETATATPATATPTATPATATPTATAAGGTATPTGTASPVQPAAVPVTGGDPGSGSFDLALVIALAAGAIAGVAGLFAVSYNISRRS